MKKFDNTKNRFSPIFFIVIALEIVCFVIDVNLPRGYSKWSIYFLPLLLIWNTTPLQILYTVTLVTVFEISGFLFSAPGNTPTIVVILNRISGLIIFWTTSLIFISRLKALREINSQREFLDTIVTNARIAIAVVTGRDLKYTYVNQTYQSIRPDIPMIGKLYREIFPEAAFAGSEQKTLNVIDTGEPWIIQRYHAPVKEKPEAAWEGQIVRLEPDEPQQDASALVVVWDVTEWDRLEKKIHESEERFRTLIENAMDAIIVSDPQGEGTVLYANPAAYSLFGYRKDEFVNLTRKKLFSPDEVRLPELLKSREENGRIAHSLKYIRKDGTTFTGELLSSLYFENGTKRAVTTIRDITERIKTERSLYESKAKLEAAMASMTDAVFISDKEGRFIDFNDAFATFHKFRNKNECARTLEKYPEFIEMFFPDGTLAPLDMWVVPRALRGEVVTNTEYKLRRKDTGETWVGSYSFAPIRDYNGNITGSIVVGRDITEAKRAVQELRDNEERLKLATEAAQLGIFDWDIPNDVPLWDRRMYEIFGMPPSDIPVNREVFVKEVLYPQDLHRFIHELSDSMQQCGTFHGSYRIRRRNDGAIRWIQYFGKFECSSTGEPARLVSTLADITERKAAEEELKKSEKRLQILNENLEHLVVQRTEQVRALSTALTLAEQRERKRVSYTLHDNLQQKLLGVRLLLGQHVRDHGVEKSGKEKYDDVADSVAILDNAIHIVKSLSVELNPPILSSQGLDASLQWLTKHMRNNYDFDIDLHIKGPVNDIRNETQLMLTQMVRELLNNVVAHSGTRKASLSAGYEKKQIIIAVSDKGKGFNPEKAMLKSTDENRLSLFTIRERLKLFNGDLIIKSSIGKGTTCEIVFPFDIP